MKFSKNNEKLCDWSNTRNIIGNISVVIYSISQYFLFYFDVYISMRMCVRQHISASNLEVYFKEGS